jgi:hypothetical protein
MEVFYFAKEELVLRRRLDMREGGGGALRIETQLVVGIIRM